MNKIERYNYASQLEHCSTELVKDISNLLSNGPFVLGQDVEGFETQFAHYLGSSKVFGVNSGTDALVLALRSLGVGPGDKVVTQANTFYATVAAIKMVGATPLLVDVDSDTYSMDIPQLENVLEANDVKAILPVHMYGLATPMDSILELSEKHGALVIEDAAQAHGAKWNGKMVGSFGDAGCFSFHPSKNLGAAGDAGAIATNRSDITPKLEMYRSLGQLEQNVHPIVAGNSRLDPIQALVLTRKLQKLDEWNAQRQVSAELVKAQLEQHSNTIKWQQVPPGASHVYHMLQMKVPTRDIVLKCIQADGVDAVVRYPTPVHLHQAFASDGFKEGQFPVAESIAMDCISLPIRGDMAAEEAGEMAAKIAKVLDVI